MISNLKIKKIIKIIKIIIAAIIAVKEDFHLAIVLIIMIKM